MADDEDNPFVRIKTYPCDKCGRSFKQESLMKHRNVCQVITKQRKVFDSGRQRATGSDVIYSKTKETRKVQIEGEKPYEEPQKSNWRQKHNDFIRSIRQARGVTEALRTGAPLPKFEPSAVPADYVNCQYCGRNFNRNAAERHIPFCEQQSKRQKINNSANQKQQLTNNRANKAPLPGQRKQSSETYGNNNGYNPNEYSNNVRGYQSGSSGSLGRGYASGSGGGGAGGYAVQSGGNARKPIKYDSQYYYESDNADSAGAYSAKNKALMANNKANTRQEQILRTGRNVTNSELNQLARNRSGNSQKESPKNSRDPSQNRRPGGAQTQAQNRGGYSKPPQAPQQHEASGAKFCHECGSEFPVQWAKFCSFCGSGRI